MFVCGKCDIWGWEDDRHWSAKRERAWTLLLHRPRIGLIKWTKELVNHRDVLTIGRQRRGKQMGTEVQLCDDASNRKSVRCEPPRKTCADTIRRSTTCHGQHVLTQTDLRCTIAPIAYPMEQSFRLFAKLDSRTQVQDAYLTGSKDFLCPMSVIRGCTPSTPCTHLVVKAGDRVQPSYGDRVSGAHSNVVWLKVCVDDTKRVQVCSKISQSIQPARFASANTTHRPRRIESDTRSP